MSNTSNEQSAESFFGKVISTYTRAQAIEDGVLIDPGSMAKEAGFKWPVALTADAWADCVAWTEDDCQSTGSSGRIRKTLGCVVYGLPCHSDQQTFR